MTHNSTAEVLETIAPLLTSELARVGAELVFSAATPRARYVAAYALVSSLGALCCAELDAPIAAGVAALEGQEQLDVVLVGVLSIAGNALLHRGIKVGAIDYRATERGNEGFAHGPEGVPFLAGWMTFRAVAALVAEPGPAGLAKAAGLLADGLSLVAAHMPDAAAKLVTFFRSVDIARIAAETPPEPIGAG